MATSPHNDAEQQAVCELAEAVMRLTAQLEESRKMSDTMRRERDIANNLCDELYHALAKVEWVYETDEDFRVCPCCGQEDDDGHDKTCELKRALECADARPGK